MITRSRYTARHLTILAAGMVAVLASIQSCVIDDTKTDLCASGRRCPIGWKCAAEQDVCIDNGCGDGIVDRVARELCDDGNIVDDETCSADCTTLPGCGNGRPENDEVCDDGNNASRDGCSGDCASNETCGNSYRDVDEACDDGNTVGRDGCSADCKRIETCGNEERDVGEVCDDGNTVSGDGCSEDCLSNETCSNGYEDVDETCDVGLEDTPECNAGKCTIPECGDGYTNPAFVVPGTGRAEQCDTSGNSNKCNANCTKASCGDGFFNNKHLIEPDDDEAAPYFEQCDGGDNGVPADSVDCDQDCTVRECGDEYVNEAAGETCEDGDGDNGDECPDGPEGTCQEAICGDGIKRTEGDDSEKEECDDGNESNNDACVDQCRTADCGDGFRRTEGPPDKLEQCDQGPDNSDTERNACRTNCLTAYCGDGVIDSGEQCDPASHFPCMTGNCATNCTCI